MRKVLRKIIEILDGTPAVYGNQNRWRGQSTVELALVTPILIVLLMGLAEIGWFANNYLILLEVTRVGARYGTTMPPEVSPLVWNNDASRSPDTPFHDFPPESNGNDIDNFYNCTSVIGSDELQGFFNVIACVMRQQMDPLELRDDNNVDDIVISAFSLQAIDPSPTGLPNTAFYYGNGTASGGTPLALITNSLDPALATKKQMIVVGRYPTNANECTVDRDGAPRAWERDPFDFFQNNRRDYWLRDPAAPITELYDEDNRTYAELIGYDDMSYSPYSNPDPAPAVPERQRGWVMFGQHGIGNVFNTQTATKHCYGSEWTIDEIETMMNLPAFSLLDDQRQRLPNQGMVLVELFWQHELLLKNPVFNPVWTILGDNTMVSVWAAFPLPVTEPRLKFAP